MAQPEEQVQETARQAQQLMQAQQQRILRGLQGGIQFLADETVIAPIKYSDSIVDLKWLLRNMLSGAFSIDTDPQQAALPNKKEQVLTRPAGNSSAEPSEK